MVRQVVFSLFLITSCDSSSASRIDAAPARDLSTDAPARDLSNDRPGDRSIDRNPADADVREPFLRLTVNSIPAEMNGSVPFRNREGRDASFRLALPPDGFTIDIAFGGRGIEPSSLQVRADKPLGNAKTGVLADTNFASRFVATSEGVSLKVPAALAAPVGTIELSAQIRGATGVLQKTLTVDIAQRTWKRDPFRLQDTWLLVFDRDDYAISVTTDNRGNLTIASQSGANGTADFVEDLRAVGLGTSNMRADAAAAVGRGVSGTNQIIVRWVAEEILRNVRTIYGLAEDGSKLADSPDLRVVASFEPGAPDAKNYRPQTLTGAETSRSFSMISIGGGDPSRRLLGLSQTVDLHNLQCEANIGPKYGVFPTTALATATALMATDSAVKALLGVALGRFVPELGAGGQRVGEHRADAAILSDGWKEKTASAEERVRHTQLSFVVSLLGRLLGALTAHEMGHALGLVAPGPPPCGLFGGETEAAFTNPDRTNITHIDTPGFNIMEAGPGSAAKARLDIGQYLTIPKFNALNLAYLKGRVLLLSCP